MKAKIIALVALLAIVGTAIAQKDKKWTDWNDKDAKKMLEDSPWAKKQNETDTSEGFYTPTSAGGLNGARTTATNGDASGQGAKNQSANIVYFVRFFSARPIREALIRSMELKNPGVDAATVTTWQAWCEAKAQDSIIVTVSYQPGQGFDRGDY